MTTFIGCTEEPKLHSVAKWCLWSMILVQILCNEQFFVTVQGSQNFKIPGSPSGRYSSDFGSPKISWTSPNKKDHKCQSKTFLIHKYQGNILLFTGNVPSNFVSCWAKPFSIDQFHVSKHCDVFLWAELRWWQKDPAERFTNTSYEVC